MTTFFDLNSYQQCVVLFGPTGFAGLTGITGQGFQGYQGPAGLQGLQGLIGFQGNVGAGVQGPQGNMGTQGSQGIFGTQGNQGNDGSVGIQGYQGNMGTQGNQGDIGTQGFQGIGNGATIYSADNTSFTITNSTALTNLATILLAITSTSIYRFTLYGSCNNTGVNTTDVIRIAHGSTLIPHTELQFQTFNQDPSTNPKDWICVYTRVQTSISTALYNGYFAISNGILSATAVQVNHLRDSYAYYIPFLSVNNVGQSLLPEEQISIQMGNANASHTWTINGYFVERLRA